MSRVSRFGSWARNRFRKSARPRRAAHLETRRLNRICPFQSLERRDLLAWDFTFAGGILTINTPEDGDYGVIGVDFATGNVLLDGNNDGTFVDTGASVFALNGPIQIATGGAANATLEVNNLLNDNFNGVNFNYVGGGADNSLVVVGTFGSDSFAVTAGDVVSVLEHNYGQTSTFSMSGVTGALRIDGANGPDTLQINGRNVADFINVGAGSITGVIEGVVAPVNIELTIIDAAGGDDTIIISAPPVGDLNVIGGIGADTLLIDGGFTDDVIDVSDLGIVYNGALLTQSGFENLVVNGNSGADTISLTLSAALPLAITLDGAADFDGGADPGDQLTINGSGGDDIINVSGISVSSGALVVNFSDFAGLTVNAGAGNDRVTVVSPNIIPTILNGDSGDDRFIVPIGLNNPLSVNGGANGIDELRIQGTTLDDNFLLSPVDQLTLVDGAVLPDGTTFVYNEVPFEFDNDFNTARGAVRVPYADTELAADLAARLVQAIFDNFALDFGDRFFPFAVGEFIVLPPQLTTTADDPLSIETLFTVSLATNPLSSIIGYLGIERLTIDGDNGSDVFQIEQPELFSSLPPDIILLGGLGNDTVNVSGPLAGNIDFQGGGGFDVMTVIGSEGADLINYQLFTSTISGLGTARDTNGVQTIKQGVVQFTQLESLTFLGSGGFGGFGNSDVYTIDASLGGSLPQNFSIRDISGRARYIGSNLADNVTFGLLPLEDADTPLPPRSLFVSSFIFYGNGGDDSINFVYDDAAFPTRLFLFGGEGNDNLSGGPGSDIILGGSGQDNLFGQEGSDFLFADFDEFGFFTDEAGDFLSGGDQPAEGEDTAVLGVPNVFGVGSRDFTPTDPVDIERIIPNFGLNDDPFGFSITTGQALLRDLLESSLPEGENIPFLGLTAYTETRAFVGRAYGQILGRAPDAQGLAFWTNQIDSGAANLQELYVQLLISPEFSAFGLTNERFIRSVYNVLFNRFPDSAEFGAAFNALAAGASRESVVRNIVYTPEAAGAFATSAYPAVFGTPADDQQVVSLTADFAEGVNPSTSLNSFILNDAGVVEAYIQRLYRVVLDREGSDSDVMFWVTEVALARQTRASITALFLNSTERRTTVITNGYRDFLGREVDPSGLNFWLGQLAQGLRTEDFNALLIGSNEFLFNNGGDAQGFVRGLYQQLLGRIPAGSEIDYWVAELGVGPRFNAAARTNVALQFMRTEEYRNILVTEWFADALNRLPTPAEREAILGLLRSGATLEQAQIRILLIVS